MKSGGAVGNSLIGKCAPSERGADHIARDLAQFAAPRVGSGPVVRSREGCERIRGEIGVQIGIELMQ